MASILKTDKIEGVTASGTVQMPAGVVIQTVDFTYAVQLTVNSSTFTDSGLTGTITPKFSNSKIYITAFQNFRLSGDHDHGLGFKIIRTLGGSDTTVYDPVTRNEFYFYDGVANSQSHEAQGRFPIFAVDTPSSTSACVYKFQFASMRTDNSNVCRMQNDNNISHGFLMEIAQ